MKTTQRITFQDWDTENRRTVYREFPAGTEVRDTLRPSNRWNIRTYRVVGVDGWIADIPSSKVK